MAVLVRALTSAFAIGIFVCGLYGLNHQERPLYSESLTYTPRTLPTPKPGSKLEKRLAINSAGRARTIGVNQGGVAPGTVISIPVSVLDINGNFLTDLKPSEFTLFVDDKPVKIESIELTSESYDVIVVIDSKAWSAYSQRQIQDAAIAVVNTLPASSRVAVVSFTKEPKLIGQLTNDRAAVQKAIKKIRISGKDSALFDTVKMTFEAVVPTLGERKAVVFLTDGYDNASSHGTFDESLLVVEAADAVVFTVYLDNFQRNLRGTTPASRFMALGISGGIASERVMSTEEEELLEWRYQRGSLYVNDLVLMTGGRAMFVEDILLDSKSGKYDVGRQLRSQYHLTFNVGGDRTGRRNVRVRVNRPNLAVLTKGSLLTAAS